MLAVRAGASEALSVCEGGKEGAARAGCPQHQSGPAAPRSPAPRPGRAELGRARAMLLTVYCVRRDLSEVTFSLQVDADFELHNFRALCELESGIPAAESQVCRAASGASLRNCPSRPSLPLGRYGGGGKLDGHSQLAPTSGRELESVAAPTHSERRVEC